MRKVIRVLDAIVDRALALVFLVVFLIGAWFIYDTAYVFRHASDTSIAAFKPGAETAEPGEKTLTADYVAWLTVDGTTIDYPVMQGEVFVLSDLRSNMRDSREFGPIPVKDTDGSLALLLRRRSW